MDLRYNITDWHQLVDVKSNTSNDLSIKVADINNSPALSGLRIRIVHKDYGTLFTCVLSADGNIISEDPSVIDFEPSTDEILKTLAKYGFLVTYEQVNYLPTAQLDFLRSVKGLTQSRLYISIENRLSLHFRVLCCPYDFRAPSRYTFLFRGSARYCLRL